MSSSQQRVARARTWWENLPAEGRPAWEDVEIAARLRVTEVPVMARVFWADPSALGRHISELAQVLTAESAAAVVTPDHASVSTSASAAPTAPPTQPADGLRSWIDSLRDHGQNVPIDDELALRLRKIRSADELYRVTVNPRDRRGWRDFLRENGANLASVLGLEPTEATRTSPTTTQPARRSGPTSPDGFTAGTDVEYTTSAPRQITFPTSQTDGILLAWDSPADDSQVRIYRVVARPDTTAWDLDLGDKGRLVTATFDTEAVDAEPFTGAKRYYAVFMNTGPTEAAARAARPVLWADGTAIQPVRDVQISTTGRRVSGRWTVSPEIDRVEILRVPVTDPPTPVNVYDSEHLISGSKDGENLDGFAEENVPSGRWEYRIYACAQSNSTTQRSPLVRSVQTIATELPEVHDLRVDITDPDRFVISWTPLPDDGLTVRIHKRLESPPAGVGDRILDAGGLERIGFTGTAITDPERLIDGRAHVECPWLRGEDRVYFTAITTAKTLEQYRVGPTVVRHRAGEVRHLQLVERVDEQFLSFAWPDGAGIVKVYRGSSDFGADPADLSVLPELAELTPELHAQLGGVHIRPTLPADGAVLHVVGLSFNDGKPTQGPAAKVHYPGLIRIAYGLKALTKQVRQGLFRKVDQETGQQLLVTAHANTTVPLALVHRSDRLPLHQDDGEPVERRAVVLQRGVPQAFCDIPPGTGQGYLRLFLDLPEHEQGKFAVTDPPLAQLRRG